MVKGEVSVEEEEVLSPPTLARHFQFNRVLPVCQALCWALGYKARIQNLEEH